MIGHWLWYWYWRPQTIDTFPHCYYYNYSFTIDSPVGNYWRPSGNVKAVEVFVLVVKADYWFTSSVIIEDEGRKPEEWPRILKITNNNEKKRINEKKKMKLNKRYSGQKKVNDAQHMGSLSEKIPNQLMWNTVLKLLTHKQGKLIVREESQTAFYYDLIDCNKPSDGLKKRKANYNIEQRKTSENTMEERSCWKEPIEILLWFWLDQWWPNW